MDPHYYLHELDWRVDLLFCATARADSKIQPLIPFFQPSGSRIDRLPKLFKRKVGTAREASMRTLQIVGRYVVIPPKCPDWTKQSGADPSNRVSSNFNCATTSNLGLMLADPGDLIRGRPKGPGDGVAASRLVRKYRDGKVAEPAAINTSSSN